jgi:uncharacterized protein with NRDE domain
VCIIALALNVHPRYRFIVASNRDEYFDRPTAPLAQWSGAHGIVAGRDLREGGTWLGVNARGRLAAVTNHRAPALEVANVRSRGALPLALLDSAASMADLLGEIRRQRALYRPFNLVACDGEIAFAYESLTDRLHLLGDGVHVLSNGPLAPAWPKTIALQAALKAALARTDAPLESACFNALAARELARVDALPSTGVSAEVERALSAIFVTMPPRYGTRASTVVLADRQSIVMIERSFSQPRAQDEIRFDWRLTQ